MFGTKLRRSPAQEAAIKWQIEIIGTKLFLRMQTKNWTSLDISWIFLLLVYMKID